MSSLAGGHWRAGGLQGRAGADREGDRRRSARALPPRPRPPSTHAPSTHNQRPLPPNNPTSYTLKRLAELPEVAGCEAKLREEGGKPYVTDNSNYIVDLYFQDPIKDAHAASKAILGLEGVVDHGLFLDMVDVCIIAGATGVEVQERPARK